MHPRLRSSGLALALALVAGCAVLTESESPLTDVTVARERWLASPPQDYAFNIEFTCYCIWNPYRVHVAGGMVVAVEDTAGKPVDNFTMTLATLWDSILTARATGDLVSVAFDQRGIPVHAEIGQLANDSGIRYTIRNFDRSR